MQNVVNKMQNLVGASAGTQCAAEHRGELGSAIESLVIRLDCVGQHVADINHNLDRLGCRPSYLQQFDRPATSQPPPEPDNGLLGRLTNALRHVDALNEKLSLIVSDMERMI